MNKNKFITILILMVIMAAIIFGLIWWLSGRKNLTPIDGQGKQTNKTVTLIEGLSKADQEAIKSSPEYNDLLRLQAICDSYEDRAKKDECLADVILNQAVLLKKPELCAKILLKQDDCYVALAQINKDLKLCGSVQDKDRKVACENSIQLTAGFDGKSLSDCVGLSDALKSMCIGSFISSQTDTKICDDSIIAGWGIDGSDNCRGQILTNQAMVTNNKALCEQIKISNLKLICQRFFETRLKP